MQIENDEFNHLTNILIYSPSCVCLNFPQRVEVDTIQHVIYLTLMGFGKYNVKTKIELRSHDHIFFFFFFINNRNTIEKQMCSEVYRKYIRENT